MSQQAFVLRMTRGEGKDRHSLVEEALDTNQINIGWVKARGLLNARSEKEFTEIIKRAYHYNGRKGLKIAVKNMWRFLREMKEDDLVVVPHSSKFYIAKVLGPAMYDESKVDNDAAYQRNVHWLNDKKPTERTSAPELKKKLHSHRTCFPVSDVLSEIKACLVSPKPVDESVSRRDTSYPLNQILYGPPGTGKTWNTVNYAVAIAEKKDVDEVEKEKREEVKQRFDELKENRQIAMVTFHQNYAYEDFIEGIRPVLGGDASENIEYKLSQGIFKEIAERASNNREKNYVLIIDEINRGNITKIFGELITLIEPSKRLGGADEATVILPYSKKSFGVPDNLYVVGTMNTADRSIALLDTALRRRFEFVEMMPDPNHSDISMNIAGVNCQELLKAMNKRITVLPDREHQIGHTYFLEVKDMNSLARTFKNKIIPLLQEYFYDNWEKIDAVLNKNGFIREISFEDGLLRDSDLIDEQKKVYELLPDNDDAWGKAEYYKNIYQKN